MNIGEAIRDRLEKLVTDDIPDLSELSNKAEEIEKERDELIGAINESVKILDTLLGYDACESCVVAIGRAKSTLLNGKR